MSALDLHALAKLPHGKAAALIREKVDPLWGLAEGALLRWSVSIEYLGCDCYPHSRCCEEAAEFTTIEVEAEDEDKAEKLAEAAFEKKFPQLSTAAIIDAWVEPAKGAA